MITINYIKNMIEGINSVEAINEKLQDLGLNQESFDGTDNAAVYFGCDDVTSRDLGRITVYLEPDENSGVLLNEDGSVYAREEREVLISVFESYVDSGSEDYYFSYTICVNGEREF